MRDREVKQVEISTINPLILSTSVECGANVLKRKSTTIQGVYRCCQSIYDNNLFSRVDTDTKREKIVILKKVN